METKAQPTQPMQEQPSDENPESGGSNELERQKLNCLEKIVKQQEKTHEIHVQMLGSLEKANNRLHLLVENQRLERQNHDRMIELLYRIAYNK